MSPDEPLLRAAQGYVAASRRFADTPTADAADAVIAARLALQEVFLAAGWAPPAPLRQEMARDRLIVEQRAGIDEVVGRLGR